MAEIITARLRLRMFSPGDVEAYYQVIHSDAEVMRYMPGGAPRPRARSEALIVTVIRWWNEHPYGLWAVERLADRALIGHCGLTEEPATGEIEIAYALGRDCWGQGLASEGARASLRYGFEALALDRIIALAEPANTASRRVMEKVGMQFEGLTTRYYDGWELALYGIAREDFAPGDGAYTLVTGADTPA